MTATEEEKPAVMAKIKEVTAERCKKVGSLTQITSAIEKDSADAKDKVAKLNAELAEDPAQATSQD